MLAKEGKMIRYASRFTKILGIIPSKIVSLTRGISRAHESSTLSTRGAVGDENEKNE